MRAPSTPRVRRRRAALLAIALVALGAGLVVGAGSGRPPAPAASAPGGSDPASAGSPFLEAPEAAPMRPGPRPSPAEGLPTRREVAVLALVLAVLVGSVLLLAVASSQVAAALSTPT